MKKIPLVNVTICKDCHRAIQNTGFWSDQAPSFCETCKPLIEQALRVMFAGMPVRGHVLPTRSDVRKHLDDLATYKHIAIETVGRKN